MNIATILFEVYGKACIHRLVYFETYDDIREAIAQEKRLKRWHRGWKIELIEKHNEDWHDLWPSLVAGGG